MVKGRVCDRQGVFNNQVFKSDTLAPLLSNTCKKCAQLDVQDGTYYISVYVCVRASFARATCTKTYLRRKVIFTTIVSFIISHIIFSLFFMLVLCAISAI